MTAPITPEQAREVLRDYVSSPDGEPSHYAHSEFLAALDIAIAALDAIEKNGDGCCGCAIVTSPNQALADELLRAKARCWDAFGVLRALEQKAGKP